MKHKFCLLALLCLFFGAHAQRAVEDSGLKVGDKVPDLLIGQVFGSPSNSFTLRPPKNQLVILDFWATWCASCISHFPDLYKLEQQHRDSLKIILVNSKKARDKAENVISFLNKRRMYYRFPCVLNDTILDRLFPHREFPHFIWIRNNTVQAITTAEYVTEANIKRVLQGHPAQLPFKKEYRYNFQQPLFAHGNGGNADTFLYKSFLSPYVPSLGGGIFYGYTADGMINRITLPNCTRLVAYLVANPEFAHFPYDRIIYEVGQPADYDLDSASSPTWSKRNKYCYEALFPERSKAAGLKLMQADLDRYFGLRIDSEARVVTCYVLVVTDSSKIPEATPQTRHETNINDRTGADIYFNNYALSSIARELEARYKIPFLDETNEHSNVTLHLPANYRDEQALSRLLATQGINLIKTQRPVMFMVLSGNALHTNCRTVSLQTPK